MSKILNSLRIALVLCIVVVGVIFVKNTFMNSPPDKPISSVAKVSSSTSVPATEKPNAPTPSPSNDNNTASSNVKTDGSIYTNVDMIVLVDSSKSMDQADPQRLYIKAIKMLIAKTSMYGSQIGIMQFSDQVDEVFRFSRINGKKDKDKLISDSDKIKPTGLWTDVGNALLEASNVLDSSHDPKNKPMIILISDGKNSLPKDSGGADASEKKQLQALALCKSKGYPVYTIGLDYVEKSDTERLTKIASDTLGKTFPTKNPKELWSILSNVFADRLNSVSKAQEYPLSSGNIESDFSVDSPSIDEINIEITSPGNLNKRLTNPIGENISIPSEENGIYCYEFDGASIIKITKPLSDTKNPWKLLLTSDSKNEGNVKVDYLYSYSLGFKVDVDKKTCNAGDTINAEAYFNVDNAKKTDPALLQDVEADMLVTDKAGNVIETIKMKPDAGVFKGSYKTNSEGSFSLYALAKGKYFAPQTQAVDFKVGKGISPNSSKDIAPSTDKSASSTVTKGVTPTHNSYILWIVLGAIVLLLAAIGIVFLPSMLPGFKVSGRLQVQSVDDKGVRGRPSFIRFNEYPDGKTTLMNLLEKVGEKYDNTDKILFKGLKGNKVQLINRSKYSIEINKKAVKNPTMNMNDEIAVNVSTVKKTVLVKYIAD